MIEITYDLSCIEDNDMSIIFNSANASSETEPSKILDSLKLEARMWRHKDKIYQIIRYDKQFLVCDRFSTSGLFRSVIFNKGNILVFSPPKCMYPPKFEETYNPTECIAQEYIEGTMINLFYDKENDDWEIATRSSIGGRMTFFSTNSSDTFRNMFLQACGNSNLVFDDLSKDYCYSFVLQHPNNRIVIPFIETKLYLVAVYKIDKFLIKSLAFNEIKSLVEKSSVSFPKNYSFSTFSELQDIYASGNTDYKSVGVMIYHKSGVRTKFRNPNYEDIRRLRGNQPKKQYRYLILRQQGKILEYLKYFNEDKAEFFVYKDQVQFFTKQLYENYIKCFIKKENTLKNYPFQYRSHMYELHNAYITRLRPKKKYISKEYVINYINNLHPAKLMYSLNYHLRKINKDEINAENKQVETLEHNHQHLI